MDCKHYAACDKDGQVVGVGIDPDSAARDAGAVKLALIMPCSEECYLLWSAAFDEIFVRPYRGVLYTMAEWREVCGD